MATDGEKGASKRLVDLQTNKPIIYKKMNFQVYTLVYSSVLSE